MGLIPDFVNDAVDGVEDVAGDVAHTVEGVAEDVYHAAGDVVSGVAAFGEKTASGLWDVAEDGYEAVMGAVSQALDYLWSLVPEPIKHPFGDSAPIHQAAAGWRAVLAELDGATTSMVAGGRSLNANWDGGAGDRFLDFLGDLTTAADQLADDVESLATALEQGAKVIDDLNHLVHAVAAELAATLVISVVLGMLTGGIGLAAGAARVVMLVARVTRAVSAARAVMFRVRLAVAAVRSTRVARWLERDANAVRVASTVGGNATSTYVATGGRSPLHWSASDWAGVGVGSALSLGSKPLLVARGHDPDDLKTSLAAGAGANATTAEVQSAVNGEFADPVSVGLAAAGGAGGAGASRVAVRRVQAGSQPTIGEEAVGHQAEATAQGLAGRIANGLDQDDDED